VDARSCADEYRVVRSVGRQLHGESDARSQTGLGKWTQATFMQAIRTGRHMGRGRQILPPMPFAMYRNFTDEDFGAIFAYLRSIPPIKNRVPEPLPPGATAAVAEK
jgi:hypothetical protein